MLEQCICDRKRGQANGPRKRRMAEGAYDQAEGEGAALGCEPLSVQASATGRLFIRDDQGKIGRALCSPCKRGVIRGTDRFKMTDFPNRKGYFFIEQFGMG